MRAIVVGAATSPQHKLRIVAENDATIICATDTGPICTSRNAKRFVAANDVTVLQAGFVSLLRVLIAGI